jgi:hypothetical protein
MWPQSATNKTAGDMKLGRESATGSAGVAPEVEM